MELTYLGGKSVGPMSGDEVFDIRKDRPEPKLNHCYDPNAPKVWGRLFYCRGTPVYFQPYSDHNRPYLEIAKDVRYMIPYLFKHFVVWPIQRLRWNLTHGSK